MAHDISNSLDLAGIQSLASAALPSAQKAAASGVASLDGSTNVVQHSSWEGAANGVATLNGSSLVNQHSIFEGQPNGVATLNATSGLTLTELLFPVSSVQTIGFTATTAFSVWLCNSNTVGTFSATLPTANTVPNGFRLSFINLSPTNTNHVSIVVGGGNSIFANGGTTLTNGGSIFQSSTFITDGVNTWYQIV